jgi:hypothetical protein
MTADSAADAEAGSAKNLVFTESALPESVIGSGNPKKVPKAKRNM